MNNEVPPPPPSSQPGPIPPPLTSPPPIYFNAPPPRRSSRGWMVLSIFLIVILGLVFAGRFASLVGGFADATGTQSGRHFEEITVENRGAQEKVLVIDVDGMITGQFKNRSGYSMVDEIEDQLKLAAKDDAVKAVVLKVDSPGGEVMASDDISRALLTFQERYKKPVVASMAGLAASGGYYISAPCQWIVANELTLTGSIGVIMSSFNYRGLMDKVGLQPRVFKSGKFKDMLRGSKTEAEIDPAELQMIQDMVMETFSKFKSVVREGRSRAESLNNGEGRTLASNWEEYADGRIMTGKTAYELGFVDQLGNFDTAIEKATELAGISRAHIIRYQEPFTFSHLLGFSAEKKDNTLKIDMGFEFPKIEAGRLYFLSPTVLH